MIAGALAFLGTAAGRYVAIAVAVLVLAGGLYACGRSDGAAESERTAIVKEQETRDEADRGAAAYRGAGGVERLRRGAY